MKYDMKAHFYEIDGVRNRKVRLREWRLKNKYTQRDLAAFLGVTELYIEEMELGTMPVQNQTIFACRHLSKLNYMPVYPL
jgi:transcriptional regulator with XRE-family HTH domain